MHAIIKNHNFVTYDYVFQRKKIRLLLIITSNLTLVKLIYNFTKIHYTIY